MFYCFSLKAATYNSATASSSDVQSAIYLSQNRDTVTIPAGTVSWSSSITITQGIDLVGAGTNSLFITNNVMGTWAININIPPGETNRVTGITFSGGSSDNNCIYVQGSNDVRRFRAYYNKFYLCPGAFKFDTVFGVVDHNYIFNNAPGNKLAHIKDSVYNGLLSGNGVWTNTQANLAGTDQAIFFEDNTVTSTNGTFFMSAIDAQAGALYVYRYNRNTNSYLEAHGSEAQYERSTRHGEIYNNFFDMKNVNQIVTFWRGGTLLVFSNNINNVNSAACLKCEDNRASEAGNFAPFGGADARNHWDINSGSNPFATGTVQSFSTSPNVVTVSGTPYSVNQYVGYTIRKTNGKTVSSLTRSGTTITVACTGHGFSNNDKVSIYGANQQEYNYLWTITVTDADHFTAQTVGDLPTTPATGTIKCCLGSYFALITANTTSTLTFDSSIQGATSSMTFVNGDTFEIDLVTQKMDMIGAVGGALIDSTVTPSFPGAWNNQTIYGCYQWSNNLGNTTPITFSPSSPTIISGTHIFNDTQAPGYTPYLYPHYLVSGVGPVAPNNTTMTFQGVKLQGVSVPPQ